MTPEQVEALKQHADAIAEILYTDTDPGTLKTLEGIEQTVRDKLLEPVSPQIGIFYPQPDRNHRREKANRKKLSWRLENQRKTSRKAGG